MADNVPVNPDSYPFTRWNFVIIVLDVALFFAGITFIDPVVVLPVLLDKLGGSEVLIGLLGALQRAGWLVPQLFATSLVLHRVRKKPFVIYPAIVSRFPIILLAIAFLLPGIASHFTWLICILVASFALFFFADGLVGVPWHDIIAKTIPPDLRGRFFGSTQFIGGILAIGAGAVVRRVLGDPNIPFPRNYGLLFALAAISVWISGFFIALIKEPTGATLEERHTFSRILRAIPSTLHRHVLLRRVIVAQNLIGIAGVAMPFYAVYAHTKLGLPEAVGGIFIWAAIGGSVGMSLVWAFLNDRFGPLAVIRGVSLFAAAVPTAALTLPHIVGILHVESSMALIYAIVFFLNGATWGGAWMGITNYIFEIAPDNVRPLFLGLATTLAAPTVLMPVIGGWLLNAIAYETLFMIAAVGAIAGVCYIILRLRRPSFD